MKTAKGSMASVIHPIFEECKNYTLDPFWKEKFSNFACNKFPHGIRYDSAHGNLILKLDGKRTEVIGLPESDPSLVFKIVMKILKEKLDMNSNRDIKIRKEEMENFSQKGICDLNCEWKKIKPKHLKDQLITDYIAKLKQKHDLSPVEVKNLISVVQLGFQFRAFSQDSVDYSDGVVKNIEGLVFDSKTRKFKTPEYASSGNKTIEKNSSTGKFYPAFKKFMREDALRINKFR